MEVVVFYSQSMAVFSWNWMTHFFHKVMIVWPAQAFKNHQAPRQFPPPCPPLGRPARQQNQASSRCSDFQVHCTGTRGLRRAARVSGGGGADERDVSEEQYLPWAVHARGFYPEPCPISHVESVVPSPHNTYATVPPALPTDGQTCLVCMDSARWYMSWICRACAPGMSSRHRDHLSCQHLKINTSHSYIYGIFTQHYSPCYMVQKTMWTASIGLTVLYCIAADNNASVSARVQKDDIYLHPDLTFWT